jgi:tRNA U34 2-thiouridine synthase MnmA/TrmU
LAQNVWSGAAPGTLVAAGSSPAEEVAVLLSGGVDSSVALRLVLEQGFKPRCFYLKIWLEDELAHLNK